MIEITPPTSCPECSSRIVEYTEERSNITTHWCENNSCPGRISDMLTYIADRKLFEIEGLGPEMAEALAKGQYVTNLADLFEFINDCAAALERQGEDKFVKVMQKRGLSGAAVLKMIDTTLKAKTASWDKWIAALGIPMIGMRLGKVLAKDRNLQPDSMRVLPLRLVFLEEADEKQLEGFGFHKKAEVNKYATDPEFGQLCVRLYNAGVRPTPIAQAAVVEGTPLAGMAFCITGEMFGIGSREFITNKLVSLGAVSKSGVTKKVTHLLVGSEAGRSKLTKAAELKIPTYDEAWVSETLEKYGIKTSTGKMDVEWAD